MNIICSSINYLSNKLVLIFIRLIWLNIESSVVLSIIVFMYVHVQ